MSSAPTSHRTFRVLAVGPRVQGVPIVPGRVRPGPFQITNLQKISQTAHLWIRPPLRLLSLIEVVTNRV